MTRRRFEQALDNHKPNGYTRFFYRYFNVDLSRKPVPIGSYFAVICFIVATTGMILFDQLGNKKVATIFATVYIGFGLFIFTLPAFLMNQWRIKRICKELGIIPEQYNQYLNMYGLNNE